MAVANPAEEHLNKVLYFKSFIFKVPQIIFMKVLKNDSEILLYDPVKPLIRHTFTESIWNGATLINTMCYTFVINHANFIFL